MAPAFGCRSLSRIIEIPLCKVMTVKNPLKWVAVAVQTLLITCLLHAPALAQTQPDSLENERQDSVLEAGRQLKNELLSRADSIRLADSLEQAALQAQILNLQASDAERKAALQARLDSLAASQNARATRIQRQVDSLRASTPGFPVIIVGDTVFRIYSRLGPFSPGDRAASIAAKVEMLVDQNLYDPNLIMVAESEESHDVLHGDIILLSITERDAFWAGQSRQQLAEAHAAAIRQHIADYQEATGLKRTLIRIGLLLLVLLIVFVGVRLMNRGFAWLNAFLLRKGRRFINGVKFRNYEFLSAEREEQMVKWLLNVLKWLTIAVVLYLALPVIFSIFPATKGVATTLFGYILNPIKQLGASIVGFIPELFTIVVIILVTRYFVRFLKFLSKEVQEEKLQLPGFYSDWAVPTYNLLRIIIYAFAFVVIFPYLPGSDSPVFQGVSVFLGLLISLGSSSAIGNIIAGLVITYMRSFKLGDRVRIGDVTGDVIEKTMLVTRVRTIKNEDITIPNAAILNGSTTNYSSSAQALGLILNSTVTIGYDVPWRKVHELLVQAARKTIHIRETPAPFVLQTSLDDFYVSYQINAYTEEAAKAARIYSDLHSNIQDAFNEAGVEILSPHYRAARDGSMVTIPPEYLPPDYQPPAFNLNVKRDEDDR